MQVKTQRDVANYLVYASIGISIIIGAIPSVPMLQSESIYTKMFGIAFIALAVVSEGIAAYAAFKFFGFLESLMLRRRKDITVRAIISAIVVLTAVVGNGTLIHMGLDTANKGLAAIEDVATQKVARLRDEATQATQHAMQMRAGKEGASVMNVVAVSHDQAAAATAVDEANAKRFEDAAKAKNDEADRLQETASSITQRSPLMLILTILVLKAAELTLVYLASPISWATGVVRKSATEAPAAKKNDLRKLTNEQRVKLGMKPVGRKPNLKIVA